MRFMHALKVLESPRQNLDEIADKNVVDRPNHIEQIVDRNRLVMRAAFGL